MEHKYFVCKRCGNLVELVRKGKCPIFCCGVEMEELVPGTTEAATEKHIPVFTVEGSTVHVTVGEVEHPMLEEHFIEWITIFTKNGVEQRRELKPGDAPKADFVLAEGDELLSVFAYCNLHNLWKAEA